MAAMAAGKHVVVEKPVGLDAVREDLPHTETGKLLRRFVLRDLAESPQATTP